MTDFTALITEMTDRFLSWKLPKSVSSDSCVTDRNYAHDRYGTNLLTADEARKMLEHVVTPFLRASAPREQSEGVVVSREVYDAAIALVPLLEEGWDEYDLPDEQNAGDAACERLIAAVKAMLAAAPLPVADKEER